jgi:hypothetical protein
MAIDVEAMRREHQIIEAILRLTETYPEATAVIERFMQNGAAQRPSAPTPTEVYRAALGAIATRGSQTAAIRRAVASQSAQFTVRMIAEHVKGQGMDIDNIAIGKVLQRLAGGGELRVAVHGAGNVPHQYEKTERFNVAA